jgi:hypothetical protein
MSSERPLLPQAPAEKSSGSVFWAAGLSNVEFGLPRTTIRCSSSFWPAFADSFGQAGISEEAMKYLCLIYDDEKKWETMSKAEADAYMGEYFAFTNGIKASGHYIGGNALQPVQTATTVRSRNGKLSTTDGPFAETKEQLGGYYLIEARDLNDALQVAQKIPSVRTGSIEVRPIQEFN